MAAAQTAQRMDGHNCAGKRISLLCEESHAKPHAIRPGPRPLLTYSYSHSHSSSHARAHALAHAHSSSHCARKSSPSRSSTSFASTSTSTSTSTSSSSSSSASSLPASYHSDSDSSLSRHSSAPYSPYSPSLRSLPTLSRADSSSSAQSAASPMTPFHPAFVEPLDAQSKINNLDPGAFSFAPPLAASSGLVPHNMAAVAASNAPYYPSSAQGALPVSASQTNVFGGFPALQQAPYDDPYQLTPTTAAQLQYQFATNLIDAGPPSAALPSSLAAPTSLAAAAGANPLPPVDPSSSASTASASANANANGTTKAKKKYPCPHAAKFNCHDTFTTSGHAARHGKKHTGEKNILCPTCHKAFTRKDNMKQHERTHKNNRNADDHAKAANGHSRRTHSISSVAASTVTHKSSNSVDMELDSPVADAFDSKRSSLQRPNLARPGQYSGSNSTASNDFKLDALARPELHRQFSGESQDGEGESPGLDALAMAATSELR